MNGLHCAALVLAGLNKAIPGAGDSSGGSGT